jgi:subtilisin family serine protease
MLGVDPKLVLVIELGASVDPGEFRRAGLRLLDASNKRVTVAFADDPQLAGFVERLDACASGVPAGQRTEPYAGFVDAIDSVRPLGPEDRISADLAAAVANAGLNEMLRIDVELWHPDSHDLALQWTDELRRAVVEAGGRVADVHVSDRAGVVLARIYAPADRISAIAELDTIASLDLLPTPALSIPQFWAATPEDLPTMYSPGAETPIVGLVDSGVASAHPLVGPAILAAESLSPAIADGEDRCGHGTMVAGLILHGPVDQALARSVSLRPFCRIVSVAVLDHTNAFPDDDLWERDLVEAIEWCAGQGATVINLSLGDARRPFRSPRQSPAAALIDELARRLKLVIVVAAGNIPVLDYLLDVDDQALVTYPTDLLRDADSGVLDPASASLVLTVGGMTTAAAATGYSGHETLLRRPMGKPGWPSPITRRGPGVGGAVKPELVERSGTLGVESGRLVDSDPELGVISTQLANGRLLGHLVGTSMAAPLITRVAAAVKARHPTFGANLVRALVLLSAEPSSEFETSLVGASPAARAAAVRNLCGFGRPGIAQAIESTSHRAVLVAEAAIPIDGVHIYELPVPSSFMRSGGMRGIDIALAYDPRTRKSRLDYLSNRLEFFLIRGIPLTRIIEVMTSVEGDEDIEFETDVDTAELTSPESRAPSTLSELRSHVVKLRPATQIRSAGTNQLGRTEFRTRLDPDRHSPMFVAVRDVNRWDDDTAMQSYGLAVAVWCSSEQGDVYSELEAKLEAVVEVEVEVRLDL